MTGDRLALAQPSEPIGWPDNEWDCLAACAYVGLDAIDDDPSDDDCDLIVGMTFAKPDDGPIGFQRSRRPAQAANREGPPLARRSQYIF
ncbi:MAG TPA: hypothetical protein VMB73_23785 [Acetobacteraceae bacterium]|nr:hypothetical protein [Acetobacteraceae bacterium]